MYTYDLSPRRQPQPLPLPIQHQCHQSHNVNDINHTYYPSSPGSGYLHHSQQSDLFFSSSSCPTSQLAGQKRRHLLLPMSSCGILALLQAPSCLGTRGVGLSTSYFPFPPLTYALSYHVQHCQGKRCTTMLATYVVHAHFDGFPASYSQQGTISRRNHAPHARPCPGTGEKPGSGSLGCSNRFHRGANNFTTNQVHQSGPGVCYYTFSKIRLASQWQCITVPSWQLSHTLHGETGQALR